MIAEHPWLSQLVTQDDAHFVAHWLAARVREAVDRRGAGAAAEPGDAQILQKLLGEPAPRSGARGAAPAPAPPLPPRVQQALARLRKTNLPSFGPLPGKP